MDGRAAIRNGMTSFLRSTLSAWNRLHPTVAATLAGLLGALILSAAGARGLLAGLDFSSLLLRGFLPFLLFAGALHIDPPGLRQEGDFVAVLSTAGVVLATLFVGFVLRAALVLLGRDVSLATCLLFGALISPTDPVAVLAIFRRAKVPRALAITVGAESLFNDGIAVVMFLSLLGAASGAAIAPARASLLFLKQTGGGLVFGLILGRLAMGSVERLETLPARAAATALLAYAGYSGVNALGLSGLLAVIVAGIQVGSRDLALKVLWTRADGVLNVLVFTFLGLAAARVPWTAASALTGLLAVPIVLAGRAVSVGLTMAALSPRRSFVPGTFRALTWGGLRGAIPLALALSLPESPGRDLILVLTYVVGLFSLVIQGSTL